MCRVIHHPCNSCIIHQHQSTWTSKPNQHSFVFKCFLPQINPQHSRPPVFLLQCPLMKRPASQIWFGSSVSNQSPCGLSPGAVHHWLAFCSKCPKAKKVSICFCFSLMSLQSYSKQKQQGSILTADLIEGGGFCVLAAWWSPLTWSHLNHNRPENDMQRSTS